MQNLWRKSRRAASMLLACAVLASMTPARALAQEENPIAPAQTEESVEIPTTGTEEEPATDGITETTDSVTDTVTESPDTAGNESGEAEGQAPEETPAETEPPEPVVTESPAETVPPEETALPAETESPQQTPADTQAPQPAGEQPSPEPTGTPAPEETELPDIRTLQLETGTDAGPLFEEEKEYTITVRFHQCINLLEDWEWVHDVRTTTVTVDQEEANLYWEMDAAGLANAIVGSDFFGSTDFWLNGHNQPVVNGSGTHWTVDLYVNLHAWDRVPDSYTHSKETGSPWDGNLVCTPLYQIQNRSSDLTVAYSFQNAAGTQNGTLASGEYLSTSLSVDGIAAAIFFVKAPAGHAEGKVSFSDGTAGNVYPLDQIDRTQGAYDFTAEIEEARAEGYTHAFYFTQWSGEERRWFSVEVTPETYTVTYDLDGGSLPVSNPLSYEVSDLENGGITLHNPTRAGYRFLGWTESGVTGAADTAMTILPGTTGNLHFTAHWQAEPAVIRFDANGGTPVTDLTGVTDQEINGELPAVTRAGYAFGGWYDEAGSLVSALPARFPAGSTTYTAQWELRTDLKYTVRYYKDGVSDGNLLGVVSGTGTYGESVPVDTGLYCPPGYLAEGTVSGAKTITENETANVTDVVYTRVSGLNGTVLYLEADTRRELAEAKVVSGLTYGDILTEKAIALEGWRLTGPETRTLIVGMGDNILVFYYEKAAADTVVKPAGSGSNAGGNTAVVSAGNAAAAEEDSYAEETADAAVMLLSAEVTGAQAAVRNGSGAETKTSAIAGKAEEEVIPAQDTPLTQNPAGETIGNSETPLVGNRGGWALVNLILAGLTVLGGVLMLLPGKKNGTRTVNGLFPAIAAVVAFIVTENMTMPMSFVDCWTPLMFLMALLQLGIAVRNSKKATDGGQG